MVGRAVLYTQVSLQTLVLGGAQICMDVVTRVTLSPDASVEKAVWVFPGKGDGKKREQVS